MAAWLAGSSCTGEAFSLHPIVMAGIIQIPLVIIDKLSSFSVLVCFLFFCFFPTMDSSTTGVTLGNIVLISSQFNIVANVVNVSILESSLFVNER